MVKNALPDLWRRFIAGGIAVATLTASVCPLQADDLRDAAPTSAYMAIHGKHNPERDYQKPLYEAVLQEVRDTQLIEKVLELIESNLGEHEREHFNKVRESLQTAVAPIEWEKLGNASEVLYTQKFQGPTSLHLFMLRVPDGGGESLKTAVVNLFNLASGASEGKLSVITKTVAGVEMTALQLPAEVPIPFDLAVGVKGDIVVLTSSLAFAQEGLELLNNSSGTSKFDDPRVIEALKHLPEPEDALVFVDAKAMTEQLQQIPGFIKMASNGNPEAARVADLISSMIYQASAFDYEVTVEYTDGFQNRTSSYGRMNTDAEPTVLSRMVGNQQPFENWSGFVPASATGFTLSSGVSLLPAYEWLMKEIPERFPETQEGLSQFDAVQDQYDVHLKEDLLESFSGEFASVSFPGAPTPFGKGSQVVVMLRCSNPDRIRELLHRGMDALTSIPQVQAQGVDLKAAADLEGFEELTGQFLGMVGIRPVIGFQDGWMVFGTHASAVQTVMASQSGEGENWSQSDRFAQFGLKVDGPVSSISYANTGESIRNMSQALQQVGTMAPMLIGMAQGQNQRGNQPDLKPVQQALALLPSVARIIAKLDFLDATMSVSQPAAESGAYVRHSVTLIKPPMEKKPKTPATKSRK